MNLLRRPGKNLGLEKDEKLPLAVPLVNFFIIIVLLFLFFVFILNRISYNYQFDVLWTYRIKFLKGFGFTLLIGIVAIFFTLIISLVSVMMYYSRIYLFRYLNRLYIETIRGTPLIVQVVFFYYMVGTAFGIRNGLIAGAIIVAFFSSAYLSELIRAAIDNISQKQLMTAEAIGLKHAQIYRLIIIPQVIRGLLPAFAGQAASIIKDTSLLSVVGISEFYNESFQVSALTFASFEVYFLMGFAYLCLTGPISLLSKRLEKKYYYES